MIKINLAPITKKGRAPKARAPRAPRPGIKIPPIQTAIVYILGTVIVALIVIVLLVSQNIQMRNFNSNINQLNAKLDELKVYKAAVDSLESRERELATLIAPIKQLNRNRFFIAHILDEVSDRVPDFTWLTTLNADSTNLDIKGIAASNLLVADFMNRLEESPYIYNVDLSVLEKKVIEKQEMMEFTLTANVGIDSVVRR
ncbi:MAG: PilN domain-containing protein [candidate division WOR-3 bacterium]|nr:MAG: PilN domain-containing protein [candidate division WOR-3 bacterium]